MKVLIIEDDWIIAQDIDEIVRSMEFETQIAHSYTLACETYKTFIPDLILSDINLGEGEKTGIDFVNQIIKSGRKAEVIFITAHNDSSTLFEVEESAPLNFLVKPYNEEQLKTSLILAKNYIAKKNVKPEGLDLLTHKELKIIELIAKNKTSKEIADELFLSDKTVRNHRYNISKKLDLSGENNSLLSWAVKNLS